MMTKFYCPKCKKIFSAEGKKKEWQSSIYGKCWKLIAKCPDCDAECNEWRSTGLLGKNRKSRPGSCSICSGYQ
jgi:hypothetical protein